MHQIGDLFMKQETCRNRSRQASLYEQVYKRFQTLYASKEIGINVEAKEKNFYLLLFYNTLETAETTTSRKR